MDAPFSAPVLVAVVITRDPGPWLEEALAALRDQDYPDLSVLVLDAGSVEDPTPRVAAVLPGAYVRRLDAEGGWSGAANEVLTMVEGADFYAFCHDDVAPDPDALRLLVEEAIRSNAGIVGPKLVFWDDPQRLAQVGLAVDKTGSPSPLADKGELDQEQHDSLRDVFVVPGGCTVVRADLFASLGGFDPEIPLHGEDVDLCWRAQVAGARVMVNPAARARHMEALPRRGLDTGRGGLEKRHRLRTMLKCYSLFHLVRVLPQAFVAGVVEMLYAVIAGRGRQARELVGAWAWNLRRLGALRATRRQVQGLRALPDSEVRRLQVRGSARLTSFVRGQLGGDDRAQAWAAAGRQLAGTFREGPRRSATAAWLVVAFVVLVGSRELLAGVPAFGELAAFPSGPSTLLSHYLSGWRTSGLGSATPAPTAFGLLWVGGMVLGGAMGLLRTLLVVGLLPLGVWGAWRLAKPLGTAPRIVAALVYLAVPVPYDALARGRWSGLVMYAATPFLLARLLRASGLAPFAGDPPGRRPLRVDVVATGLLLAVVAAFAPVAVLVTVTVGVALVLGSLLVGDVAAAARALAAAVGAAAVAVVLHFPWSLDFVLPGASWATFAGVEVPATRGLRLHEVLRFETGPVGAGALGWAFLLVAALALFVGRGWRLGWTVRMWVVALAAMGVTWAGGRGWLGVGMPAPEVLLAPAAAALALAAALGMAAFHVDLRGYHFGWRQAVSVAAGVAGLVTLAPVAGVAIADGRWGVPDIGWGETLAWMGERGDEGAFRVLWIGDPEALPMPGWQLAPGLAYGTSRDGPPTVLDLWPAAPEGSELLADAVRVAVGGDTSRLGRLLAPMAVRYVVVPERSAPTGKGAVPRRVPPEVDRALAAQLDLRRVETDVGVTVYENTSWAPGRVVLTEPGVAASLGVGVAAARLADLSGGTPVLTRRQGPARFTGDVPGGATVYLSEGASDRWRLRAGGETAARRRAFGWANAFTVAEGGPATVEYRTPPTRTLSLLLQLGLWLAAVRALVVGRRRLAGATPGPSPAPAPSAPTAPTAPAGDAPVDPDRTPAPVAAE